MPSNMAEEMLLWKILRIAEALGEGLRIEFDADELVDLLL